MNPFPGLRAFEQDDADLFFGREEVVDRLLDRLAGNRLLAVIGSSGSGKSSLVRAGLVPALAAGHLGQGTNWKFVPMRPGADPVGNLSRALEMAGIPEAELTLRISSQGLVDVVRRHASGASFLIIVDQFEEIFRFQRYASTEDHEFFAASLTAAAHSPEVPIYVVLTMRGDFFGDLAALPRLPEALSDSLVLMPRMTRMQLQAAIEGPIRCRGGDIDPPCVHRLLNEVQDTPDSLVRMQHVLMRMWDARGEDRPIGLDDYLRVGGIEAALDQHAEAAFHALEPADRELAMKVFQSLSEEENGRIIRRPRRLSDIVAMSGGSAERVHGILMHFSQQRFLRLESLSQDTVVDLAHEALLRNWRRLAEWTVQEAAARNFYLRLTERAKLHAQGEAALMSGPDLKQAEQWWHQSKPHEGWASRYQANVSQVRQYLERSQRARKIRRVTVVALAVFVILLMGLVAFVRQASTGSVPTLP